MADDFRPDYHKRDKPCQTPTTSTTKSANESTKSPKSSPSITGDPWSFAELSINAYWTRLRAELVRDFSCSSCVAKRLRTRLPSSQKLSGTKTPAEKQAVSEERLTATPTDRQNHTKPPTTADDFKEASGLSGISYFEALELIGDLDK